MFHTGEILDRKRAAIRQAYLETRAQHWIFLSLRRFISPHNAPRKELTAMGVNSHGADASLWRRTFSDMELTIEGLGKQRQTCGKA